MHPISVNRSVVISASDLASGLVVGIIVVVAALGIIAIWLVPRWQARRWTALGLSAREVAELETSARGTMIQLLGGIALMLTFVATWLQISDTRRATDRTLQLTADQQEDERFTRAIEQLDSKRLEIRVGAIYGLGGLADTSPKQRAPIAQVLSTYLQQRYRDSKTSRYRKGISGYSEYLKEANVVPAGGRVCPLTQRPADDMQAALDIVLRLASTMRPRFDVTSLDLSYFHARNADFRAADVSYSYLTRAQLEGAHFDRAELTDTDFTWTCLRGASFAFAVASTARPGPSFIRADLTGADLSNSRLAGWVYFPMSFHLATLRGADMQEALLQGVDLSKADLREADLSGADLRDANLTQAQLNDAHLRDADLRGARLLGTGLRRGSAELLGARIDKCTRLPWRSRPSPNCL
jgi:uncharacterized protein YjbI with pentapeptide repeats